MSAKAARKMQKVLWHIRWVLLAGIIIYDVLSYSSPLLLEKFLRIHAIAFAVYFLLGLLEGYFECKGSCKK